VPQDESAQENGSQALRQVARSGGPRLDRRTERLFVSFALALSLFPALAIARIGRWVDLKGRVHPSLFDDAMISMSYARTLASGKGLIWYPGAPRVEGITNLLWTLILALVHRAGFSGDSAVIVVKVLGLGTVWLGAIVAVSLARSFNPTGRPWSRFLAALVIAANIPLLFWAVQGMEVGLLTFLTLATCALSWRIATVETRAVRDIALLGLVVVAGVATRNDFVIVAFAPLGWAACVARRRFVPLLLPLAGAATLAFAATVVFRLSYYGVPFPNTYYLKLTGVPLSARLVRGSVTDTMTALGYVLPGAVIIVAFWRRLKRPQRQLIGLLVAVAITQFGYSAFVGGDAWEYYALPNRYLTPAFICINLAAVFALSVTIRLALQHDRYLRWVLPAVAMLAATGPGVNVGLAIVAHRFTSLGFDVSGVASERPAVLTAAACGVLLLLARFIGRRLNNATATAFTATAFTLLLIVAASPEAFARAQRDGGAHGAAEIGVQTAALVAPQGKIAVFGAGATQYFANRPMIDMLGKNDRHIANESPATPFFKPGHNKWDIAYSVGQLKPDVVVQPPDARLLPSLGYERMRFKQGGLVVWVRISSPFISWDQLVPVSSG